MKSFFGVIAGFVLGLAVVTIGFAAQAVYIQGRSGELTDVVLDAGVRKLAVLATTVVEQVFGKDPQGSTFFFFGATLEDANGIGAAGNTVRVQIPAAPSPLNTVYPAVDVTYTIVAGDIASSNPERTVALNVCSALEADSNFTAAKWDCVVAKDFAYVHIVSKLFNEFGTRSSYTVTCSGSTVCNYGYADITRRGKETELSRSPNDPARLGVLAISGSVQTVPGGVGDYFQGKAMNGASSDMRVNGSVTPVNFDVLADSSGQNAKTRYITSVSCFGGGNGIKFGSFLSNAALSAGIRISITSLGQTFTFFDIKETEDFKNYFSSEEPGSAFRIDVQAGGDQFISTFKPDTSIVLAPNSSDKIRVAIRDNLSSGLQQLECSAFGFEKEE